MNTLSWEYVKEFYKDSFGIDGWVVEMYANMDILSLCASGASNKTIETFLEIPEGEIVKVLRDTFDTDGWEQDLPINPYKIFNGFRDGNKTSLNHFIDFTKTAKEELSKFSFTKDIDTEKLFYLCETMYDIERKIQDEWI